MVSDWKLLLWLLKFSLAFSWAISLDNQDQVCMTRQCIAASHRIFESMNLEADPCEDFEEFACGGWKKNHDIPDDNGRFSELEMMKDRLDANSRKIIEAPIHDDDFECHKKAKLLYKSCMDVDKLEELGVEPLKSLLDFFGWPVLQSSWTDAESFDPWQFIIKMNQLGLPDDYLLGFDIQADSQNTTKRALHIDQPSFGPSKEFLDKGLEDPVIKAYYK